MNSFLSRRNRACVTILAPALLSLAGCEAERVTPVVLNVPGLPSPELALQQALDRTHGFMASLNDRIATPARQVLPLYTTNTDHGGPLVLHPVGPNTGIETKPSRDTEAAPRFLRSGATWFGFGDGYVRVHCRPGQICVVNLQPGERLKSSELQTDQEAGWTITAIKGTRGVHASWAVALTPHMEASVALLHIATTKRRYVLVLDPSGDTMQSVRFIYDDSDPKSQPEPSNLTADGTIATAPSGQSLPSSAPDFGFIITGASTAWKPLRAYREGDRTYIQFPPGAVVARPRLVILAPSGAKADNYRAVGDSYVIDQRIEDALLIGPEPDAPSIRLTHRRAP